MSVTQSRLKSNVSINHFSIVRRANLRWRANCKEIGCVTEETDRSIKLESKLHDFVHVRRSLVPEQWKCNKESRVAGKVYVQLPSFTNCNISACFKGYLSESSVILSTNSVLKCTSASVVDFRYANNFSQTVSTFEAFVMWQRRSNVCKEIIKRVTKDVSSTRSARKLSLSLS